MLYRLLYCNLYCPALQLLASPELQAVAQSVHWLMAAVSMLFMLNVSVPVPDGKAGLPAFFPRSAMRAITAITLDLGRHEVDKAVQTVGQDCTTWVVRCSVIFNFGFFDRSEVDASVLNAVDGDCTTGPPTKGSGWHML